MTEIEQVAEASNASKRLARLVAVQALYQATYEQDTIKDIIKHSLDEAHDLLNGDDVEEPVILEKPDAALMGQIVQGVTEHRAAIEEMIVGVLDQQFSSSRMEVLLKTIICAGVYELHHHADIDAGIIISDYVDVTRAFFNAKEPGLVNAVLDKLAKKLRS